ncbi:hypothetical protein L873DRAFT_1242103 [Choiromyces venosus 120613-1]|uniref:Uncharacterized protein n=1 Tax=Choiromyces venosus 120613-1 TaxID=1336337 RepID=A0A3N4JD86_9PEZI|nr:hypothetical protein L873DRAFT_1242103 [Choiromyces venosus 120613-1]
MRINRKVSSSIRIYWVGLIMIGSELYGLINYSFLQLILVADYMSLGKLRGISS